MGGTVLAWPGHSGFGIASWLREWEKDPLAAMSQLEMMSDRDSYPGQYLKHIVEGGNVSRDEVGAVMLSWLSEERWSLEKDNKDRYSVLREVVSGAWMCSFQKVLSWIVENFEKMYGLPFPPEFARTRRLKSDVLLCALRAQNAETIVQRLEEILLGGTHPEHETALFALVYKHGFRKPEGNRYLCCKGRQFRRLCGHYERMVRRGEISEKDATALVSQNYNRLRYLLILWFLPREKSHIWSGDVTDAERSAAETKAARWVRSQSVSLPIM